MRSGVREVTGRRIFVEWGEFRTISDGDRNDSARSDSDLVLNLYCENRIEVRGAGRSGSCFALPGGYDRCSEHATVDYD